MGISKYYDNVEHPSGEKANEKWLHGLQNLILQVSFIILAKTCTIRLSFKQVLLKRKCKEKHVKGDETNVIYKRPIIKLIYFVFYPNYHCRKLHVIV